jgi:hypothetical protein
LCSCFSAGYCVDLVSLSTRLLSQTRDFLLLFDVVHFPETSNSETTRKLFLRSRNQPEPNSHELFLPIPFKFRPTTNDYAVISKSPLLSSHISEPANAASSPSIPSSISISLSGTVLCKTRALFQARMTRLFPMIQSQTQHHKPVNFYAAQGCRLDLPTLRFWLWGSLRFCI